MNEESKIFHESWYRIANEHISLRASVKIRRQLFRGSRWYVLHDPFNNQFFRLRPPAYEFVSRLSMSRTVEEVWKEVMTLEPDNAPGQEDVIQLLTQLYHANLLHYELPADSKKLFERYKERKQKIVQAALMNIMFFRIPLFDPDRLLKRLLPIVRLFISPFGAAVWIGVVAAGVKLAIDNFSQLSMQTQGILSPSNIPLLYLSLILIKSLHEFGHAFTVRRFGGEVHTMGVMFLIFNPLPYVDATAAWAFRSKWRRVLVGASGMVVEVFVAACAIFIWANTGPGVIHALMYNMIFIASVSTILFNINPLLRFDGYYILSDLLDIPNLHTQASQHLRHLVERYAFGYKQSKSPTSSGKEAFWLTFFGILSGLYKVVVFATILLFVANRFLLLGIIMAAVCAVAWVITPLIRLVRYLATSPRLERTRLRAISVCVVVLGGCLTFLYFFPFPNSFRAPGVLEASEYVVAVNNVSGYIVEIVSPSGTRVKPGDDLLKMENKELEYLIKEAGARLNEALAMRQKAMSGRRADMRPIESLIASIQKQLERFYEEKNNLVVRAEIEGIWVAPNVEDYVGMWLRRGTPLGQVVNDQSFYFASVVSQQDISQVFSDAIKSSEIRLTGQSESTLQVTSYMRIPVEQTELPSVTLGLGAGGDIAVDTGDATGTSAAEPFYEVRLGIAQDTAAALYHGRSGRVKFKLPLEPLLRQWYRKLRQLLQERYQL
jgi:putative peptide zinc metalloprotease protein